MEARCKHLAAIVQEYEYHALQAVRLAQHLKTLKSVVVWVDYNPTSFGVHGKPILQCLLHLNSIAHMQVSFHVFFVDVYAGKCRISHVRIMQPAL